MVGTAPLRNNLLLLFPHLGGVLMGGAGEQVARSSCRSSDPVRFVFDGWHTALSQVALVSTVSVVFGVLQWGAWMTASSGVPLLRSHRMKLTTLGSSGHGEEPQPTCHKASVSSLAAVRFIGSKSIIVCEGAPPDLGMMAVLFFLQRCLGDHGRRRWMTFWHGTRFCRREILGLFLVEDLMPNCKTCMYVLW